MSPFYFQNTGTNGSNAMAFQPVPNGIEVAVHAEQNGIPVVNVYHVKTSGTVTDAELTTAVTTVYQWMVDSLFPTVNASYVLVDITATDLSVAGGHQAVLHGTITDHGADALQQAAGNAALVLSWRTARIGRSYRGRTYIGGLSAVQLATAQNVTSGVASVFAGVAQDLIDALNTAGLVLSVLSRVVAGVLRVTGVLTEIISIVVDTKVDSQRKRTAN